MTVIAALAALGPGVALGQNPPDSAGVRVEGEVLDVTNNVPVAAAIVAIPALNRSTVTDELGYFQLEGVPAGFYPIQVHRLGYATLEAEVPLNGQEVLGLYLTPGPVSLEGIEVKVTSEVDMEQRAMGISTRSIIGPLEMEELRERYFSLDQIFLGRHFPRARFRPGRGLGDPGCLMVSTLTFGGRRCATVVVDGVLLGPDASEWVYRMSTQEVFSVRFLHGPGAALRYGHRGSDGVLLIETRAGR
jgi:hypothetical protein